MTDLRRFGRQLCLAGCALALLAGALTGPVRAAPAPTGSAPDTVSAAIDAYIAGVRAAVPLPGVSVAVVNHAGVVHLAAYGEAAPGRAATPQTPFWIASLSKPFTALAVRQLINAGRLDLETPVTDYIPWFTLADPAAAARITIRRLLDHTSGLPTAAGGDVYFNASPQDTRESLVRGLSRVTPGPIGQMAYSNYNYIVLGYLIEVVTGQSYEDYLREHILTPLGLTHTHFSWAAAQADGGAAGYRLLFGLPVAWGEPYKPAMQSSGYLLSSAEDLGRFAQLYLNDAMVAGVNLTGATPANPDGYYSIYWQWIGSPARSGVVSHEGAMLTNNSAFYVYPGRDLAVTVLLNIRPDGEFPNLNAATLADNIAAIAGGAAPLPPNDRGWRAAVRGLTLQMLAWLALGLASLAGTLLWRARGRGHRWPTLGLGFLLALDTALAAYGLLAMPFVNHVSWRVLVQSAPDINGSVLLLGCLFTLNAAFKVGCLWPRRSAPARLPPTVR